MTRPRKVLIVDDDKSALQAMAEILEDESYQVTTVASGARAIELLRRDSFDLVLTDLKMPGVDGLEVLRQARECAPKAVVLILTGYASLESAIEALREGAYDYLMKPCSAPELKLKIERGLEKVRLAEERQQAEETLRESEERIKEFVEKANDIIYTHDLEGNFTSVNPAATQVYGYTTAEVLQLNIAQIVDPEYLPLARRMIQEKVEGASRTGPYELLTYSKEGKPIWVEVSTRLLQRDGQPLGVLGIARDVTERKRAEEELLQSYAQLRRALEGTVGVLLSAIELRDPYTAGHQQGVTRLACAIASEMGLSQEQIEGLRMAALIHDLGKINVPAEILSKPGKLQDLEYGLIKAHPQIGYDILKTVEFPWPVAQIVLQHHERPDGSGYPAGLSDDDILLEAKILAVADVVEAMASIRPYRPALGLDKALEEISQNRGVVYDPEVVDVCLKLFTEKGFRFE